MATREKNCFPQFSSAQLSLFIVVTSCSQPPNLHSAHASCYSTSLLDVSCCSPPANTHRHTHTHSIQTVLLCFKCLQFFQQRSHSAHLGLDHAWKTRNAMITRVFKALRRDD